MYFLKIAAFLFCDMILRQYEGILVIPVAGIIANSKSAAGIKTEDT